MTAAGTEVLKPAYGRVAAMPGDLRLDANEGRTPEGVYGIADRLVSEIGLSCYPDMATLEKRLAEREGTVPARVVAGAGADDLIERCIRWAAAEGRTLILHTPTFEMIERYAEAGQAPVRTFPWVRGAFPFDQLSRALEGTRAAVFLVTPNNPTGGVISTGKLREFIAGCPEAIFFVDLAYAEFGNGESASKLQGLENVVLLRTFSKAWGLASLRVGYAVGPPPLVDHLRRLGCPYPVSGFSSRLVTTILEQGLTPDGSYLARVQEERQRLLNLFDETGFSVEASGANFVFAYGRRARFLVKGLATLGVRVRGFTGRAGLEDALRITCPGETHDWQRLESALLRVLVPEALLFDMDGVLADVSHSYRRCIVETVRFFGADCSQEDIEVLKRRGGANNDFEVAREILRSNGCDVDLEDVCDVFNRLYQGADGESGLERNESLLIDPELLARLAEQRPLAVVTGRPRRDAESFLERFGLRSIFRVVVTAEDTDVMKPDPAPVLLALEELGCSRAWMIGDTPDDVSAARAAGVVPIGFLPTCFDAPAMEKRLEEAGVSVVLDEAESLEELLR